MYIRQTYMQAALPIFIRITDVIWFSEHSPGVNRGIRLRYCPVALFLGPILGWTYIGRLNKCSFSFASHTFAGSTFAVEYISSWNLLQLPHLQFYSCAIGTLAAQHFCSCTSAAHTLSVYLFAVDTYPASHICCWHICSWTAYVAANICSSTFAVKVVLLQFHICSRGTILAATYLTWDSHKCDNAHCNMLPCSWCMATTKKETYCFLAVYLEAK